LLLSLTSDNLFNLKFLPGNQAEIGRLTFRANPALLYNIENFRTLLAPALGRHNDYLQPGFFVPGPANSRRIAFLDETGNSLRKLADLQNDFFYPGKTMLTDIAVYDFYYFIDNAQFMHIKPPVKIPAFSKPC